MTTLTNSAEGGTNSTTVTAGNSGGASGNAFDAVTSTNATFIFDNTHIAHGALAYELATAGTAASPFATWSTSLTSSSIATVWFRLYLYVTANPAAAFRVFTANTASTVCASLLINTNGTLKFNNTSGSQIVVTTNTVPLNQWFRVEGFVTGSAASGQVQLILYDTPDSITPTETQTSNTSQSTSGPITQVRFGVSASLANVGPYWMDDIGVSTTGLLGPAFTLAPGQPPPVPRRPPARAYVQGTPLVTTPAAAATPSPFTLTGGMLPYAGGVILQQFSQTFTSSGSWTAPANLAGPPSVYAWGPSGTAATGTAGTGAGGGGGGGIGVEPALGGVAAGTVLTVTVGTGGSGNPTTVTGGAVTVTGNAGGNASVATGGTAGAASGNTLAFAGGTGGNGAAGASGGGGGGGGSGGAGGAGGNGAPASGATGGGGGSAGTGNPAGAAGGNGGTGSSGAAGTAPGGAGGGGSGGAIHTGGAATAGQALITWQVLVPVQMAMQRRAPVRSQVRFTPVQTTNASAAAAAAPRQQPGPARRRTPARAYIQFTPVRTTNNVIPVVKAGTPPTIPTSGGDRSPTIRVFRQILPGDVPASGAQLPRLTGRAFAVPIPVDTDHATHAWDEAEEEAPPIPAGPSLLDQARAELDELAKAARDAADAIDRAADRARPIVEGIGSKAYDLGKIFGSQPYDPRPRKVCGSTHMAGGVVLTCQRKPHDDGWHSDKGLHWR